MIRRDIPKKTKQIGVRFSEDEKLVVEAYVQNHTQAISVSEWIRELVFSEIQRHSSNGAQTRIVAVHDAEEHGGTI